MQQAAASLTSEEARQQAQAERLTLVVAENTTGYFGVQHRPGKPNPIRRRPLSNDGASRTARFSFRRLATQAPGWLAAVGARPRCQPG